MVAFMTTYQRTLAGYRAPEVCDPSQYGPLIGANPELATRLLHEVQGGSHRQGQQG